jgi:hypothetical protein
VISKFDSENGTLRNLMPKKLDIRKREKKYAATSYFLLKPVTWRVRTLAQAPASRSAIFTSQR